MKNSLIHSIKTKYFIILTLAILCPVLILSRVSFTFTMEKLVEYRYQNYTRLLQSFRDMVFLRHMEDMEKVLQELASYPDLGKITTDKKVENEIIHDWDLVRLLYPERAWIYFGDHQNRIKVSPYWEPDEAYDLRIRPWYRNAVSQKGIVWSLPFKEYVTEKTVLTASIEIFDNRGISQGVLAIDTFLDQFMKIYKTDIKEYDDILLLMDQDKRILASNHPDFKTLNPLPFIEDKYQHQRIKFEGQTYYTCELPIPSLSWNLMALIPKKGLDADTEALKKSQWILLALSIVIAGTLAYLLSNYIILKLNGLNRFMQKVEKGNLNARQPENGKDEFARLNKHINAMTARLSYSIESSRSLTQLLTHSISNSLTSIDQRLLRLMDHPTLAKGCRLELDTMEKEIISMQFFIQNTTLARTKDLDQILQSDEMVELDELLNLLKERSRRKLQRKGQSMILYNPEGKILLKGNQLLLLHCLENLTDNAIKYSPPGESIEVSVEKKERSILLEIVDYGEGVKPEEQKVLFNEKFTKTTAATGNEISHGIGLSVASKVIQTMGGNLRYIDRENCGGVFQMEIPRID